MDCDTPPKRGVRVIFLTNLLNFCPQSGVKSYKAAKKPRMSRTHMVNRSKWCRRWSKFKFSQVIFSDEKRFVRMGDGPTRVWRRKGERYLQQFMTPATKFKGGSVMVWGCISYEGVGPLIRCSDHMDSDEYKGILAQMLTSFPRLKSRSTNRPIFQHDNASCHSARSIETFLRSKNVTLLPWPALSPAQATL